MTLPLIRFAKRVLPFAALALLFRCSEDNVRPKLPADDTPVRSTNISSPADCSTCTYIVPTTKHTVDGLALGLKPGAVVCLNAALTYPYLAFKNLVGEPGKEIVIINCGGPVTIDAPGKPYVIKVYNSKHFRVSGGKVTGTYGIKLKGASGNGLVLGPFATDFIVNHLEVSHVGFAGIMAKTDPTCDDATIRGNFIMKNVYFHSNYIHDTTGEGFYVGHSSYGGANTSCGVRLPHLIESVRIYRNIVRASGWDGIQLSSAPKNAHIYENLIENFSTANKDAQRSGICIGGGTGGWCYSNMVRNGNGPGISVFGLGNNVVYNNIILNPTTMGIFCDERTPPGTGYKFLNNTIINPKTEGIRFYAETVPNNVFANNIVINPGSYPTAGAGAYIVKYKSAVLHATNNYFSLDINSVKFVNAGASNFRLGSGSPAIDKGLNISGYNILTDHYLAPRLTGTAYDIGASEFR